MKNRLILTNQSGYTIAACRFTDADKARALAVVKQVSDTFLKQDKALILRKDSKSLKEDYPLLKMNLSAMIPKSIKNDFYMNWNRQSLG